MMARNLIPWRKRHATPARREADPVEDFRQRMDALFEDFFGDLGLLPARAGGEAAFDALVPSLEVSETDDAIEVRAELPGMEEKDIEVELGDGLLTVRGEKREEREEKKRNRYLSERRFGHFQRTVPLPCEVNRDAVKARFKRGVLSIALPKTEQAATDRRRIAIDAG